MFNSQLFKPKRLVFRAGAPKENRGSLSNDSFNTLAEARTSIKSVKLTKTSTQVAEDLSEYLGTYRAKTVKLEMMQFSGEKFSEKDLENARFYKPSKEVVKKWLAYYGGKGGSVESKRLFKIGQDSVLIDLNRSGKGSSWMESKASEDVCLKTGIRQNNIFRAKYRQKKAIEALKKRGLVGESKIEIPKIPESVRRVFEKARVGASLELNQTTVVRGAYQLATDLLEKYTRLGGKTQYEKILFELGATVKELKKAEKVDVAILKEENLGKMADVLRWLRIAIPSNYLGSDIVGTLRAKISGRGLSLKPERAEPIRVILAEALKKLYAKHSGLEFDIESLGTMIARLTNLEIVLYGRASGDRSAFPNDDLSVGGRKGFEELASLLMDDWADKVGKVADSKKTREEVEDSLLDELEEEVGDGNGEFNEPFIVAAGNAEDGDGDVDSLEPFIVAGDSVSKVAGFDLRTQLDDVMKTLYWRNHNFLGHKYEIESEDDSFSVLDFNKDGESYRMIAIARVGTGSLNEYDVTYNNQTKNAYSKEEAIDVLIGMLSLTKDQVNSLVLDQDFDELEKEEADRLIEGFREERLAIAGNRKAEMDRLDILRTEGKSGKAVPLAIVSDVVGTDATVPVVAQPDALLKVKSGGKSSKKIKSIGSKPPTLAEKMNLLMDSLPRKITDVNELAGVLSKALEIQFPGEYHLKVRENAGVIVIKKGQRDLLKINGLKNETEDYLGNELVGNKYSQISSTTKKLFKWVLGSLPELSTVPVEEKVEIAPVLEEPQESNAEILARVRAESAAKKAKLEKIDKAFKALTSVNIDRGEYEIHTVRTKAGDYSIKYEVVDAAYDEFSPGRVWNVFLRVSEDSKKITLAIKGEGGHYVESDSLDVANLKQGELISLILERAYRQMTNKSPNWRLELQKQRESMRLARVLKNEKEQVRSFFHDVNLAGIGHEYDESDIMATKGHKFKINGKEFVGTLKKDTASGHYMVLLWEKESGLVQIMENLDIDLDDSAVFVRELKDYAEHPEEHKESMSALMGGVALKADSLSVTLPGTALNEVERLVSEKLGDDYVVDSRGSEVLISEIVNGADLQQVGRISVEASNKRGERVGSYDAKLMYTVEFRGKKEEGILEYGQALRKLESFMRK